jgi:photosystem II stability/assembly factor-like uncharacterized protein
MPLCPISLLVTALLISASWEPQASGVTARLRGVSAISDTVAWASGAGGTIVRTPDGGRTWGTLTIPGERNLDFRDIDAIDASTAYLLSIGPGDSSRIYKTTDAGQTWIAQFVNAEPSAFYDAMAFWDARRGIAFSDSVDGRFVIVTTGDGGRTWTRVPDAALPPALPNEGAFAASGTNVAVIGSDDVWIGTGAGSTARVLHSSDAGRTWSIAATPLAAGPSAGIFSIAFRDVSHGIVVGGDYKKEGDARDNAAVTSDGGRTWTLVRGLSGFRSAVAYVPGAPTPSLIAVGPTGADYSNDEGRTWTAIAGAGYHAFSFAPRAAVGWGVGENGRIAKLTVQ